VVLDVNVIISGVLARDGAPARMLRAWGEGTFELIVSPALLDELGRAFSYPKLRERIHPDDAATLLDWLARLATVADDLDIAPARPADPDDDYLIALAASNDALLVSGDKHLLDLANALPIVPPARFIELIDSV
jgi:putative PIN family toxin of toxin-antitoxin system